MHAPIHLHPFFPMPTRFFDFSPFPAKKHPFPATNHRLTIAKMLDELWRWLGLLAAALALAFVAFQMHLLPPALGRVVGRICFLPTYPLTLWQRRGALWTLVDSHVLLGAAPVAALGHVDQLYARGVRAVVNLCDEYAGPLAAYRKRHVTQLYLPTVVRP